MSWGDESVWNLFQVFLAENYVPSCYESLKIKIWTNCHLLSIFCTFWEYIRTIPYILNLSSRAGVASSVSDVTAQSGCLRIMKPSLSCTDEFNFLSIVTSYWIHLLLIFIFKGCLLLQAFFSVTANTKHLSKLSALGYLPYQVSWMPQTAKWNPQIKTVFSIWMSRSGRITSEVHLVNLSSQKLSIWCKLCFCLSYIYPSSMYSTTVMRTSLQTEH